MSLISCNAFSFCSNSETASGFLETTLKLKGLLISSPNKRLNLGLIISWCCKLAGNSPTPAPKGLSTYSY